MFSATILILSSEKLIYVLETKLVSSILRTLVVKLLYSSMRLGVLRVNAKRLYLKVILWLLRRPMII